MNSTFFGGFPTRTFLRVSLAGEDTGAPGLGFAFFISVALWPTWLWYAERMTDGSDEPCGCVALIAALFLSIRRLLRQPEGETTAEQTDSPTIKQISILAALLTIYGVSSFFLPPLLRAVVAMAALAYSLSLGRKLHWGTFGLFAISLPVIASMQFFLGYPLRLVTTKIVSLLLSLFGYCVTASGTLFLWRGDTVVVDAPCSGIKMLWTGLFLCFFLSSLWQLKTRATWKLYSISCSAVFLANVTRTFILFLIETKNLHLPGVLASSPLSLHTSVGTVLFAAAIISILFAGEGIKRQQEGSQSKCRSVRRSANETSPQKAPFFIPMALLSISVAALPLFKIASAPTTSALTTSGLAPAAHAAFPGWPTTFQGLSLSSLPLLPAEQRAAREFPGNIGRFSDGQREIVLRYVTAPTRLLHPTSDCLKGSGYSVTPAPLSKDQNNRLWGCVVASRNTKQFTVCEHIYDSAGNSWSDPSSWFWAAMLQQTQGPWWSEAVSNPA